jgi:hypothetical protein
MYLYGNVIFPLFDPPSPLPPPPFPHGNASISQNIEVGNSSTEIQKLIVGVNFGPSEIFGIHFQSLQHILS